MDWHNAVQALLPTLMETRLRSWSLVDINAQQDCLFYSGRIPQEITDLIFEFALSPDIVTDARSVSTHSHDFCVRLDHERSDDEPELEPKTQQAEAVGTSTSASSHAGIQASNDLNFGVYLFDMRVADSHARVRDMGFDWFRPDHTGRAVFNGQELLRTCRRVYLDANKILEQQRILVVWGGRKPYWGRGLGDFVSLLQLNYPSQLPKTSSIRWFAQMRFLETSVSKFVPDRDKMLDHADPQDRTHLISQLTQGIAPVEPVWRTFHNLEHFHLTIRRTDWYKWEDNKPLVINPYRCRQGQPLLTLMRQDMHASMVKGEQRQYDTIRSWSTMFRAMRNLKTLTISLETSEDKKDEMEEIVAWARTWRFEIMSRRYWMGEDGNEPEAYLVAEDRPARKMSWRGLRYHWSKFCTACGSGRDLRPDCGHCMRKHKLVQQNKGPRLLVWTLTWRPEPVERLVDREGGDSDTRPSGLP